LKKIETCINASLFLNAIFKQKRHNNDNTHLLDCTVLVFCSVSIREDIRNNLRAAKENLIVTLLIYRTGWMD